MSFLTISCHSSSLSWRGNWGKESTQHGTTILLYSQECNSEPLRALLLKEIQTLVGESWGHQEPHLLSYKIFALTVDDYTGGRYLILGWKYVGSIRHVGVHVD